MDIFGVTWIDFIIVLTSALTTAVAKIWGPEFLLSYTAMWVFAAVFFGYIMEPMADALRSDNLIVSYFVFYGGLMIPMAIISRGGYKLLKKVFATIMGRRIDFALSATYYRPDGSILGCTTLNTHVEAPWTGSRHSHGLGWSEPGKWPLGQYRVDVCEGKNLVATAIFAIANTSDSGTKANVGSCAAHNLGAIPYPTGHVTSIDGRTDGLRFFERGNGTTPQAERVYCTTFSQEATRRVAWELRLKYPSPYRRAYHIIGWGVGALGSFLVLSLIMSALEIEESQLAAFMASLSDVITSGFVAIANGDF